MIPNIDESILTKIKNALIKAEPNSGTTEAEAQSALLMAQKLMAKHNIDMSQVIDTVEKTKTEIEHGKVTEKEKKVWWKGTLATIIAENFRCYSYYDKYGKGLKSVVELRFLGVKEDVQVATEVFKAAAVMIDYYSKEYLKARKKEVQKQAGVDFKKMTMSELEEYAIDEAGMYRYQVRNIEDKYKANPDIYKMRLIMAIKDDLGISINPTALMNTFIDGFLDGLAKKFKEQVKADQSLALVLVINEEVDAAHNSMKLKSATPSSARTMRDSQAHNAGYQQGKSFSGAPKGKLNEGKRQIKS